MDLPATPSSRRDESNSASYSIVASALRWQAELHPGLPAIHFPASKLPAKASSAHLSHLEFEELTENYARGLLELEIKKGTRAALIVRPGLDFLALFFALTKVGAVPVLIDESLPDKTIKHCLAAAGAEVFFGSSLANVKRKLLGWARSTCRLAVNTGPAIPGVAMGILQLHLLGIKSRLKLPPLAKPENDAAIVFSGGQSGAPKGVVYQHKTFAEQARMFQNAFGIAAGETNLTTIPHLAVLDPAMDAITVIPPLKVGKPKPKQLAELVEALNGFRVNNFITSPGMLNCLGAWLEKSGQRLVFLRRIICCGDTLSIETLRQFENALHQDAEIHMTYGCVESYPLTSITNVEFDSAMQEAMENGEGICVGRPVGQNRLKIIAATSRRIDALSDSAELPPGMIGEIIVNSPTMAGRYVSSRDEESQALSDNDGEVWFRTGDAGSLDGSGRLWYCGKIAQGIETSQETLYPQQAEALFDQHPDLRRSAVVGVGTPGRQLPVLCVELNKKLQPVDVERVHFDLLQLAQAFGLSRNVRTVLFHRDIPVHDYPVPRVDRKAVKRWAESRMRRQT